MRWGRLGLALAGLLFALGALILASAAVAREKNRPPEDFSNITTKAAANRLVKEGRLVKIHFFPTELGGPAKDRHNISYITPEAEEARSLLISVLEKDIDDAAIDEIRIEPHYKGDSIIPTRIRFKAWHSQRTGGEYETVLEVW